MGFEKIKPGFPFEKEVADYIHRFRKQNISYKEIAEKINQTYQEVGIYGTKSGVGKWHAASIRKEYLKKYGKH